MNLQFLAKIQLCQFLDHLTGLFTCLNSYWLLYHVAWHEIVYGIALVALTVNNCFLFISCKANFEIQCNHLTVLLVSFSFAWINAIFCIFVIYVQPYCSIQKCFICSQETSKSPRYLFTSQSLLFDAFYNLAVTCELLISWYILQIFYIGTDGKDTK